jgi:transcription elongation factor GreA
MAETQYLTAEGAERLKAELIQLKGPERTSIAERLRSAISMGDLSENADYHKAKEDQSFLEGRIQELEYTLYNAIIVQEQDGKHEQVEVGATITVQEEDFEPEKYLMVGAKEADSQWTHLERIADRQSVDGKKEGETVTVDAPMGKIHLKIIKGVISSQQTNRAVKRLPVIVLT